MQIVHKAARAGGRPLIAALRDLLQTDDLKPKQRSTLRNLLGDFDRWRVQASELPHTEVAQILPAESGYCRVWQGAKSPAAPGRLDNLQVMHGGRAVLENFTGCR